MEVLKVVSRFCVYRGIIIMTNNEQYCVVTVENDESTAVL